MEQAIANQIVTDALALNYTVSVYDSEEWALKRSGNHQEIIAALNSTGWDQLKFRKADGEYVGVVALIWGESGYDLVNDYTSSEAMESLLKNASDLAEKFSEQS